MKHILKRDTFKVYSFIWMAEWHSKGQRPAIWQKPGLGWDRPKPRARNSTQVSYVSSSKSSASATLHCFPDVLAGSWVEAEVLGLQHRMQMSQQWLHPLHTSCLFSLHISSKPSEKYSSSFQNQMGFLQWHPAVSNKHYHENLCGAGSLEYQAKPLAVPAAPLLIELPVYDLGEQQTMAQVLGALYQCWKPRRSCQLLTSEKPSSNHCKHLGNETADESSLSVCVSPISITLPFQ